MNLCRLAAISRKEVLQVLRDSRSLLIVLLMPLMLMTTLGYGVNLDTKHIRVFALDEEGSQAKDGSVGLIVSCEMDQPSLQKVLYDLEAGMPFLFVDQLDVQVPQTTSLNDTGSGRIRVVLGVSGQWQGGK